jgi:predicted 3-demethylubiquinone-9 3-methyltransferase (glyoxalase superfamily)
MTETATANTSTAATHLRSITPVLTFRERTEEAVNLYVSLFPNSRIVNMFRSEGFSLMVTCSTQEEIDRLWDGLTAGGGEPGRCGWLKDRFGLSWQVIPADLGEMLGNPAGGNTRKAGEAMMGMNKLDIAALRAAYSSAA